MTAKELKTYFSPQIVDLGVVRSGETRHYAIKNNSPLDIWGHTKSCQCVGEITSNAREVTGSFPAEYKETNQELYKVNGKYCQKLSGTGIVRWFNVEDNQYIDVVEGEIEGPFKATLFTQSVGITMDNIVSPFLRKDGGEIIENPDYLKTYIPVKAWILQSVQ